MHYQGFQDGPPGRSLIWFPLKLGIPVYSTLKHKLSRSLIFLSLFCSLAWKSSEMSSLLMCSTCTSATAETSSCIPCFYSVGDKSCNWDPNSSAMTLFLGNKELVWQKGHHYMQTCQVRLRTVKCKDMFNFHLLVITKRRFVALPSAKTASYNWRHKQTVGWTRNKPHSAANLESLLAKQQAVHTIHPSFKIKSLFSTSIFSFS